MDKSENILIGDPMGSAIMHYWKTKNPHLELMVETDITEPDPYPVSYFFRDWEVMPAIEQEALRLAKGHILDVGAGSGTHALVLQNMGKKVLPIDISELSVEVMHQRDLPQALCQDFYTMPEDRKFDTILLMMNGIGIVETMDNFPRFFAKADKLLTKEGQILADSSDIIYMFQESDGGAFINLNGRYYGEVEFKTRFQNVESEPYPWLFVDFYNLQAAAEKSGFQAEYIKQGPHYDYLARITRV